MNAEKKKIRALIERIRSRRGNARSALLRLSGAPLPQCQSVFRAGGPDGVELQCTRHAGHADEHGVVLGPVSIKWGDEQDAERDEE